MNIAGIITAAGLSSRMGDFKPLLELGGKKILCREVELLLAQGVAPVIVVAGHRADEVRAALASFPAQQVRIVMNPRYHEDMFLSVQAGVAQLPEDTQAFFFLPADCPAVSGSTIRKLIDAWVGDPVCFPRWGEHRGHPPLISAALRDDLLTYEGTGGLKQFLRKYPHTELAVEDPEITRDIDTPEEYQHLLNSHI